MGVASVNLLKTQLDWLYRQDCCMPDNSSIARNCFWLVNFKPGKW